MLWRFGTVAETRTDLRKLDALLAEHLFQWRHLEANPLFPLFSSTYEGMGEVLEAMAERGWLYILTESHARFRNNMYGRDKGHEHYSGHGLPEAVARATLAALGVTADG
jgi:hypothetical protein